MSNAEHTLPREVLRWVQSLDLSYSVKNVKRDFSNGFLVAEIFSRYHQKYVTMHSYDNGQAMKNKKDNWNQLIKVFHRIGLPHLISETEAHYILCCEEGAAVRFVSKIYEVLTERQVQTAAKKPTMGKVPNYSKETGTGKVKMAMKLSNLDENSDLRTITRVMSGVVLEHERSLTENRGSSYYSIQANSKKKRAPNKLEVLDEDTSRVRVKEIQVKQVDRNISHMRAAKEFGVALSPSRNDIVAFNGPGTAPASPESYSRIQTGSKEDITGDTSMYAPDPLSPSKANQQVENSNALLNGCISRVLGQHNHPNWSDEVDATYNLYSALDLILSIPEIEEIVIEVFKDIASSAALICDSCTYAPKQFWKVADVFIHSLTVVPVESSVFPSIVEAFDAIGRMCARKDPHASLSLFFDFVILKISHLIFENSSKRGYALRVLYSFSSQDVSSHFECIRKLKEMTPNIQVFICCMSVLVGLETFFNEELFDEYTKYASIGLVDSSPTVRAASMYILAVLLPTPSPITGDFALALLPELTRISLEETWWEVQAHLLALCVGLVGRFYSQNQPLADEENEIAEKSLSIVRHLFSPKLSCRNVKIVGLLKLTSLLKHFPDISSTFIAVLNSLSNSDRDSLLVPGASAIILPTSSGNMLVVDGVIDSSNAELLTSSVKELVAGNSLDRMTPCHLQIFSASLETFCARKEGAVLNGFWDNVFNDLKDHIFVALCDPQSCNYACYVLSCYTMFSSIKEQVLSDPQLIKALKLLYGSGNKHCQKSYENMLRSLCESNESLVGNVMISIDLFRANFPQQFATSGLGQISSELA